MLKKPFNGTFRISQNFGQNLNNFYKLEGRKGHAGVDFAMPNGTPLYAVCDGEVLYTTDPKSSARTGWGLSILTDKVYQVAGQDCRLSCLYAHLKEGSLKVKRGDRVIAGQLVALSNNTGQTTGPHLHFATAPLHPTTRQELWKDNGFSGYIDPLPFLDLQSQNIKIKELQELLNKWGAKLVVDGKLGKKTDQALKEFLI